MRCEELLAPQVFFRAVNYGGESENFTSSIRSDPSVLYTSELISSFHPCRCFSDSCNVCKMIISSKGGNTSTMLKKSSHTHGLKKQECLFDTPVHHRVCVCVWGISCYNNISATQASLAEFSLKLRQPK